MTIVTKGLTSEKKGPVDAQPLVKDSGTEDVEKGGKGSGTGTGPHGLNERYHYILRTRAARVSSATTLCLLITALLVMTVGLFGGLYIYRQMTRARFQKLWCNVPYDYSSSTRAFPLKQGENDLTERLLSIPQLGNPSKIDDDGLSYYFGDDAKSDAYFREDFELDLDDELFSKIEVPDFRNGRTGRFIHEFDSNKTAIVDQTAKRCFVMPLDREQVLPPKSMFDMIQKMSSGYYSVDTKRVRKTMRVVTPALDDLSGLGEYIKQECLDKATYRLEKSTSRIKRGAGEAKILPYAEFAGFGTIEYDIVNIDQLP